GRCPHGQELAMSIEPRRGQAPGKLGREQFRARFRSAFYDPAYRSEDAAIDRLEAIAWQAYAEGRKAPITRRAGAGYADPAYELSGEWLAAKAAIETAAQQQRAQSSPARVLVIIGSARNDGTCPGEVSKSWRLAKIIEDELAQATEVDLL